MTKIHSNAICDSINVAEGTTVWAFTHILAGAVIGKNCNICENVFIENEVVIGNNVTIKNGVQIWDGVTIEDNAFIGPNVTFTNDRYPKSRNADFTLERILVKRGASLGGNCTILPGITIGISATVGAGSVVVKDVADFETVVGNPARPVS